MSGYHDAKVTKQYSIITVQQHILRFDIAMDQFSVMGMLERCRHLLDVGDHLVKRNHTSTRMRLAQRPFGNIVHHEKRRGSLDSEVEDAHNMQVLELRDDLRLAEELLFLLCA